MRLSLLWWDDEFNDASSAKGREATSAAPGLSRVCRSCWQTGSPKQQTHCSWMDCWSEPHSLESWRAYNYPHVATVYWSLYRSARWANPPLATRRPWEWYLRRAHATSLAVWKWGGDPWTKKQGGGVGTAQWGLMVGSAFELVLSDLLREGWGAEAAELQVVVEKRMRVWLSMPFPYGSEFAWDSTGHEEIATWLLRFGRVAEAALVKDAVTAYVSSTPHWGFCGSARRWWDFTINGAEARGNERVLHHYAGALNSVPLYAHALQADPANGWLWRLAHCASAGSLTNIRADGSASMGFHAELMARDAYSADFGVGFYGHWRNAGAHLVCVGDGLGWACLGCDLASLRSSVHSSLRAVPERAPWRATGTDADGSKCFARGEARVISRDAFGRRAYLQPLRLVLVSEGARMTRFDLAWGGAGGDALGSVSITVVPAFEGATHSLLGLSADGAAPPRIASVRCVSPHCAFAPVLLPAAAGFVNISLGGASVEVAIELRAR